MLEHTHTHIHSCICLREARSLMESEQKNSMENALISHVEGAWSGAK